MRALPFTMDKFSTYKLKEQFVLSSAAIFVLLLITGSQSQVLDVSQCDSFVRRTDGIVCYVAFDITDNFGAVQKTCQARGMTMLEILTQEENEAVSNLLNRKNMVDSWLAATQTKGTWRWLDGVELSDQGCFNDSPDDPDIEYSRQFTDNSVTKCLDHCRNLTYSYAALEARTLCRCGNGFGRYGQQNANCGNLCPGNESQTCGGYPSQQIYSVQGAYSNWLPGQPNDNIGYQTCANIDSMVGYQWQDVFCKDLYKAVCELPRSNGNCTASNGKTFVVNNRCLLAIEASSNFYEARYTCRSEGGDLIMHVTSDDTTKIAQQLNVPKNSSSQYYIGLMKWPWTWNTNNEFLFTNWIDNQPAGPGQDCITIKRDTTPGGQWAASNCNTSHLYICQKSNSTAKVTVPLFTMAPTTPPRRTAAPFSRQTTRPSGGAGGGAGGTGGTGGEDGSSIKGGQATNSPALIGGIVGAVVGGIIIIVIIITLCVVCCRRSKRTKSSKPPAPTASSTEAATAPSPPPPTYYFGIDTAPRYSSEKNIYPSLPNFGEETAKSNYESVRSVSNGNRPDVIPAKSVTAVPSNDNYYMSSDIYNNAQLSY